MHYILNDYADCNVYTCCAMKSGCGCAMSKHAWQFYLIGNKLNICACWFIPGYRCFHYIEIHSDRWFFYRFFYFLNFVHLICTVSLLPRLLVSVFSYNHSTIGIKWEIVETLFARYSFFMLTHIRLRKILIFSTRNDGKIQASWMELRMRIWLRVPAGLWLKCKYI